MNSNNRLYSTDTSVNLSDFSDLYEIEECMICLEPLNNEIAQISCSHKYHFKCIEKWMKTNKNFLKACCICENNTEIVNILNFDSFNNQNNKNQSNINQNNKNKNNINQNNINQNNINHRRLNDNEDNVNNNNNLFGCCNIL